MNAILNRSIRFINLGLADYQQAWDYQTRCHQSIVDQKIANRDRDPVATDNFLLVCQHPHVFTLGKSGDEKNLVVSREQLPSIQATFHQINRGGDITYHGPGQLVAYPILDLENFFTDIHLYMRSMEEAVILTLKDFGLEAGRLTGLTGVWLDPENPVKARKICAMGVKTSRWVTMHGLALNVSTDLNYFNYIVPCGITDKAVTSMEKELGAAPDFDLVLDSFKRNFALVFQAEYQ